MPEVGSFESLSQTITPPKQERSFPDPVLLARIQKERSVRRSLYESHTNEERQETERFMSSFNQTLGSAFGNMDHAPSSSPSVITQDTGEKKEPAWRFSILRELQDYSSEREKIANYGNLADLAYVDFVRESSSDNSVSRTLRVRSVHLDPLSFPNIRTLDHDTELTENERRLAEFMRSHPPESFAGDLESFDTMEVSRDTSELLYIASSGKFDQTGIERKMATRRGMIPNQVDLPRQEENGVVTDDVMHRKGVTQYASLDAKYRTTLMDGTDEALWASLEKVMQDPPSHKSVLSERWLSRNDRLRILQMNAGLEHVRTFKTKESSVLFETMQDRGYAIIDHFPDSDRWDSDSSGFSAIAVRDRTGKLHISVRGTELTDFGDIGADFKLIISRVPEHQTRDLIVFMDRTLRNLPVWERVRIIGHSLGGALGQLGSVMYDDWVEETYTFNSPWVRGLSVSIDGETWAVREKFEKYASFGYTGDNDSVESRMTNVKWIKWPSIIADLWHDIGRYKIDLKELSSHSITRLVQYVEYEAMDKELRKQDTYQDGIQNTRPDF